MERYVSGDAPSRAHSLFVHSIQAFGRASLECMNGKCALFHVREAIRRREAYLRISYGLASVQNILDLRSDLLFIIF